MNSFDVFGAFAVAFGVLNVLFPGLSFRSRFLTSKGSTVTEVGTDLTRITGGALVVIGLGLLIF